MEYVGLRLSWRSTKLGKNEFSAQKQKKHFNIIAFLDSYD